ncbi:hypothetical protein Y032_0146g2527 [Ancylostoma ceylanicum]|uniref:Uncharacterized protein n=1 Tax=Ancylostoma ceylanicum TaxID=53326 RepID=A0A016T2J0_9BILA|nr:hypothetical protein Y032_0146g2527 [Ancylostoma ceylanicum]
MIIGQLAFVRHLPSSCARSVERLRARRACCAAAVRPACNSGPAFALSNEDAVRQIQVQLKKIQKHEKTGRASHAPQAVRARELSTDCTQGSDSELCKAELLRRKSACAAQTVKLTQFLGCALNDVRQCEENLLNNCRKEKRRKFATTIPMRDRPSAEAVDAWLNSSRKFRRCLVFLPFCLFCSLFAGPAF